MKHKIKSILIFVLAVSLGIFAGLGISSVITPCPDAPVSNMTQSDSIELLKVEIEMKQTVIDEQVKALKACDELTEQLMKGLE